MYHRCDSRCHAAILLVIPINFTLCAVDSTSIAVDTIDSASIPWPGFAEQKQPLQCSSGASVRQDRAGCCFTTCPSRADGLFNANAILWPLLCMFCSSSRSWLWALWCCAAQTLLYDSAPCLTTSLPGSLSMFLHQSMLVALSVAASCSGRLPFEKMPEPNSKPASAPAPSRGEIDAYLSCYVVLALSG